eukprot:Em0002g1110a
MLVKSTPKWLSYSSGFVVVTLFDQDVQKCFTSCTGVHPSIAAWKQAQLSLSRGGLGLRSLSHHAPAAFIASLCFSGLGSISHVHLLQSLEIFNSSVHQSDNIQIGSVLEKLPSQKTLSSILDDNLFRVLQGSLSIADRARLLSASSPHASSWLTVTPSEGQGLHLDPPVFQTALKWWLGLDTAEGSICALCPDKMLDPLGHHATTCKRGGDVVFRHNKLRDILAETCRRAHLSVQVEAGCNLTPDHSHSRPADVLISNWVLGKTAACDISVTSPLNSNIMSEAGVTAGAAAQATELRKHEANDVKCSELGWLCIPLVVESYGAWGKEAMESFSSLASRLAITSSRPKSAVLSELYGRLNLNLVRANFVAQKRADAAVLLSQLAEVGAEDPQVAFLLLRQCAAFCKLVHLARSATPSHIAEGLALFDRDVRQCFAECTAVDAADVEWMQAQLSLSYLASISSSGCDKWNLLVEPIELFNGTPLSGKIEDQQFRQLFHISSPANRARLLSISSRHAASWLTVVPSPGLNLHLEPNEFQIAVKWWLGMDVSFSSCCPHCPDHRLDPLGHHALTCKHGGDVVLRHNSLRDVFVEFCHRACLGGQVEVGSGQGHDRLNSRPADVLVKNWHLGKHAAFDLTITSPLNPTTLTEAGVKCGSSAQVAEVRKHAANDGKCKELGWVCIPLAVESYGCWAWKPRNLLNVWRLV